MTKIVLITGASSGFGRLTAKAQEVGLMRQCWREFFKNPTLCPQRVGWNE
ncbi:hypothetical protein [Bradyrhizobium sp.]|jgi:hypothetical protein|nr:hypothetical protein [Bradyrhizobium sp.]HEV2156971.1 hypothetical protein [Bradyrhizobium sp.]